MGNLLKQLVKIPEAERTYGKRPLAICHGDFHAKNFGFVGDELVAVYDFDKLTEGLACADLVNALCLMGMRKRVCGGKRIGLISACELTVRGKLFALFRRQIDEAGRAGVA